MLSKTNPQLPFTNNQHPKRRNPMKTTCPECEAEITLAANAEVNEIIVCPDCGVDLEITSLDPVTLELAPMEEEDWGE
jgi:alpha-aminoadipate/glutamate carrier protein LysW